MTPADLDAVLTAWPLLVDFGFMHPSTLPSEIAEARARLVAQLRECGDLAKWLTAQLRPSKHSPERLSQSEGTPTAYALATLAAVDLRHRVPLHGALIVAALHTAYPLRVVSTSALVGVHKQDLMRIRLRHARAA